MAEELKSHEPSHHHHRRSRGLWRGLTHIRRPKILSAVIAAVLIYACGFTAYLVRLDVDLIKQELSDGQWHLERAAALISGKPLNELSLSDFEEADQHLIWAEELFRQAQGHAKLLVPFISIAGGDASALPHLIEIALNTTQAGQELYAGTKPLLTLLLANHQSLAFTYRVGVEQRIIAPLLAGQPRLVEARDHMAKALIASQQIDRAKLSDETAIMVGKIDPILPRLYSLTDNLVTMPDLLSNLFGVQEQKAYLVLSQNNDELRPTGGFISTFGVLAVKDGQIVNYGYHSTTPPNLTPPDEACPVKNPSWWIQLQEPVWACWDAQWTADFPTLARQAEWFYEQGDNLYAPVDGVIAIDLVGTEALLNAIGPVEVAEYGETISAENMHDRIYYYRAQEGDEPHKKFIASMFKAILGNLVTLPPEKTIAILEALWTSMEEKHLLFYFDSPDLESLVATLGADGDIHSSQGDNLFVVDSSLTTKGYTPIQENIEYEVIINPDGSLTGQVTLDWAFPAGAVQSDPAIAEWVARGKSPDFWDFARVYIPKGGIWSGTDGNDSPTQFAEEMDKAMLGNLFILTPGANKQIRQHYLLPDSIQKVGNRSYYRLLVQKQPGTRGHSLTVRITLPQGAALVTSRPAADSVYELRETVVEFRVQLVTDQAFEVVFR